jgi:hypothetical protein
MKKFVKITTRLSDGNVLRQWIDIDIIVELTQNSATQWSNDEGTLETVNGAIIPIISFNETIDALN